MPAERLGAHGGELQRGRGRVVVHLAEAVGRGYGLRQRDVLDNHHDGCGARRRNQIAHRAQRGAGKTTETTGPSPSARTGEFARSFIASLSLFFYFSMNT